MSSKSDIPVELSAWVAQAVPGERTWQSTEATTASVWRSNDGLVVKAYAQFPPDMSGGVAGVVRTMEAVRRGSEIVVPDVVAVDESGEVAGLPTMVMTSIAGEEIGAPTRRQFDRIIDVAEQLHVLPTDQVEGRFKRYNPSASAPSWFGDSKLFTELASWADRATDDGVFIHRDFHPGNMRFSGDQLTGVFDWDYACIGPSAEDYAHMWLNLAIDHGDAIATVFASRAARRMDPAWTAACWIDWLPHYEGTGAVEQWGTPAERQRLEEIGRLIVAMG